MEIWKWFLIGILGAIFIYIYIRDLLPDVRQQYNLIKSMGLKQYINELLFVKKTKHYIALTFAICGGSYLILCLCIMVAINEIVDCNGGWTVIPDYIEFIGCSLMRLAAILSLLLMCVFLFESAFTINRSERENE